MYQISKGASAEPPPCLGKSASSVQHFLLESPALRHAHGFERAQAITLPKNMWPENTAAQGGATAFLFSGVECAEASTRRKHVWLEKLGGPAGSAESAFRVLAYPSLSSSAFRIIACRICTWSGLPGQKTHLNNMIY